jgi:hypothetical protein
VSRHACQDILARVSSDSDTALLQAREAVQTLRSKPDLPEKLAKALAEAEARLALR